MTARSQRWPLMELLSLRHTARQLRARSPRQHALAREALPAIERSLDAAWTLWTGGQVEAAITHAGEAFDGVETLRQRLEQASEERADAEGEDEERADAEGEDSAAVALAWPLSRRQARQIAQAQGADRRSLRSFALLRRGAQVGLRSLRGLAMTRRQLWLLRGWRWCLCALGLALCGAAVWGAVHWLTRAEIEGSAYFNNDERFSPDKALDGDPQSEWQSPDGANGWFSIRFSSARDLQQIQLFNGHNRHHVDRAVRSYRVEFYDSDARLLGEIEGEFEELQARAEWVTHEARFSGVRKILFRTESFHGRGAALGELRWD